MKECIECSRILPESKFRAYETKSGIHYTNRCRLCESSTRLEEESRIDCMDGWPDTPMSSWWPNFVSVERISCMEVILIV